ncbi:intracellular coagulation inhibitor 1-like [Ornithodoros turicata]|uniref:intracellular coagulation inhibitor 1-like n=1 Tax=Ornithodoros turicata TaxID=34597 RepID=UPI003139D80D
MMRAAVLVLAVIVGAYSSPDEISRRVAKANNILGVNLLKELPTNKNHVFLSPFSISMAMSMVYRGARGVSEKELGDVLGYEKAGLQGSTELLSATQKFFRDRDGKKDVVLEVANAVLVNKSFPIVESYKKDLRDVFRANLKEVDFSRESQRVASEINQWVSTKTRGQISKVVSTIPKDTLLFIMNAVYFKGDWTSKFDAKRTKKLPFYNYGKTEKQVNIMTQTSKYSYTVSEELKASLIELPYKGKEFSMVIVLPLKRDGLEALLTDVTAANLETAVSNFDSRTVVLKLPKFKLESEFSLVKQLKGLGAQSIFQANANLTGINERGDLVVSDVLHKALVEVNEKGSKAAAFTSISMRNKSLTRGRTPPIEFNVDHPFLFFIRSKVTGLILFMGAVNEL